MKWCTRNSSDRAYRRRSISSRPETARRCCCGIRGCRMTRSPRKRGWRAAPWGQRWRGPGAGWSRPTRRGARGHMSHADEGTLHAYLDGELSGGERERVAAHLAECEACRARLDEERALVTRARDLLALAAPAERPAAGLPGRRRARTWDR